MAAVRAAGWASAVFALTMVAGLPAQAVDGVVEINQAKILSSGGFPYNITQPGSYRLTSNIDVSGQPTPQNVTAITINAHNVTLDLNGFTIQGPVSCTTSGSGGELTCSTTGSGRGISMSDSTIRSTVVKNGYVTGMGGVGIYLGAGKNQVIEGITVMENGAEGIHMFIGRLSHIVAVKNNGAGAIVGVAVVTDYFAYVNKGPGIDLNIGVVSGAVMSFNGGYGMVSSGKAAYSNVAVISNNGGAGSPQISGAVAGSVCDTSGTACP
jgi:hypothetical protein